jgi:hypothetical protein
MYRELRYCRIPGYAPVCCDLNSVDTLVEGYNKRLFHDLLPRPLWFLKDFEKFVQEEIVDYPVHIGSCDFYKWLNGLDYPQSYKRQMEEAFLFDHGSRPPAWLCHMIEAFGKGECYNKFKPARSIHTRKTRFKAWSGPRFHQIEEYVYQKPEFIKHTPVNERPALIKALRNEGIYYYQTDHKSFESQITPEIADICECALYRHVLANDPDIDFLCNIITGRNRIHNRRGIYIEIDGRRMSGDSCTSLGNGFTNLMLLKYILKRKGQEFHGYVEGDDGIFATNVIVTSQDFAEIGFECEVQQYTDPCEASFCGMIFGEDEQIIRDPFKFMSSFAYSYHFIDGGDRLLDQLQLAKALSACWETPSCPIVGVLARYVISHVPSGTKPRYILDGYHDHPPVDYQVPPFRPTYATRLLFDKLYGIDVQTQVFAENCIIAGDFQQVADLIPAPRQYQIMDTLYRDVTYGNHM